MHGSFVHRLPNVRFCAALEGESKSGPSAKSARQIIRQARVDIALAVIISFRV
jgi:hypothetical protein